MILCDESIRYHFNYKKGLDYRRMAELWNIRMLNNSKLIMNCAQFILLLTLPGEQENYDDSISIRKELEEMEFYISRMEADRKKLEAGIFEY